MLKSYVGYEHLHSTSPSHDEQTLKIRGVGRGGQGGGHGLPIKSGQGAKKGHIFLASFGLSAINQYFLVTLFPHIVNLPTHLNF